MKTYWQYFWNRVTIALIALTLAGSIPFIADAIYPTQFHQQIMNAAPWWPWAIACGVMWTVNLLGTWIAYRKHYVPMWKLGDQLIHAEHELDQARRELQLAKDASSESYKKAVEFSERLHRLQGEQLETNEHRRLATVAATYTIDGWQLLLDLVNAIAKARDIRSIRRLLDGSSKYNVDHIETRIKARNDLIRQMYKIEPPF